MRVVLGGVFTVSVGAAVVGWLGGPYDAAVLAFFALWGMLLLSAAARPVHDDGDDGTDDTCAGDQLQDDVRESV